MQEIVKCSNKKCPKFFVDTPTERQKALHNRWVFKQRHFYCHLHYYFVHGENHEDYS